MQPTWENLYRSVSGLTLKIYNAHGQLVRTLVEGPKKQDHYNVVWDGRNDRGNVVTSGVYFYRLTAGNYSATKKLVLLK